MTRSERLRRLAADLRAAAQEGRRLASSATGDGHSREAALSTQIIGVAMEFEVLAEACEGFPQKSLAD